MGLGHVFFFFFLSFQILSFKKLSNTVALYVTEWAETNDTQAITTKLYHHISEHEKHGLVTFNNTMSFVDNVYTITGG